MAETDTILQLGIDAAREGNREEARNLFNLVTRQDPNNAQGWLWLAGVADSPDERRAALERVVALEPNNEMASRGLQAMGVNPQSIPPANTSAPQSVDVPPVVPVAPVTPVAPSRDLTEEELYASELDSAFDDYDTVEKAAPPPREYEPTPIRGADEPATERVRMQPRRSSARRVGDDDAAPRPRRWLFLGLIAAIALAVLFLWIIPTWRASRGQVAQNNAGGALSSATSESGAGINNTGGLSNTGTLSGTTGVSGTNTITDTPPLTSTGGISTTTGVTTTGETGQPVAPTPEQTAPVAPAATDADLAAANPQPVGIGTQLSANGYNFTYPNANYAAVLGKQVGGATAQGNFVLVLVQAANTTGTAQPIPADFFVLKDAQGRVYTAQPQVSSAYVQRGINADLSQEDALPANGLLYSVPLIFDVQPGATNLVLFARGNTGQGFQVLNSTP